MRSITRRTFLGLGLGAAATLALPSGVLAQVPAFFEEKSLTLHNINTGETLQNRTFFAYGDFVPETIREFDWLLRDFRTEEINPIDRFLFLEMHALQRTLDVQGPIEIISGYRSPHTNRQLSQNSNGVAKNSLHMQGMAIDLRYNGRSIEDLYKAALSSTAGGVGFYPQSRFVHIDTGSKRTWRGEA